MKKENEVPSQPSLFVPQLSAKDGRIFKVAFHEPIAHVIAIDNSPHFSRVPSILL